MTPYRHACMHTHTRTRMQFCRSSGRPVSAPTQVQSQDSASGIYGEQSDTETGSSPSTSALPYQYRSTNVPYSFNCHPVRQRYCKNIQRRPRLHIVMSCRGKWR